jgi:hypothetical protein
MAEQKRGGFHALEERIHQLEAEDARQEEARRAPREPGAGAERTASREGAGRGPSAARE